MELKPGYKQTEVGVIPQEWNAVRLGEIGEALIGLTYKPENVKNFGTLVLRSSNIQDDALSFDDNVFVDIEIPERIRVREGDVLVCVRNGSRDLIGKSTYLDARVKGMTFGAFMAVHRSPYGKMVGLLFQSSILKRQINEHLGATINQITNKSLNSFVVPMPASAGEQSAIATALSDVDALLIAQDALIAKKRAIKQGAMQELLTGKRRLPGFGKTTNLRSTEIGDVPEGWTLTKLEDLVDPDRQIRYGIVQPGEYDPTGRYMIRGQDYSAVNGWASPEDVFRVSAGIEYRYRSARVKAGDLIMTIVGYCGHVEQIPAWLDGANLTQTTARIAIDDARANVSFCRYALQSSYGARQVSEHLKGAAQPGLNIRDIEKFLIPLPSMKEQEAVSVVLRELDEEIRTLLEKRSKTARLKQGMMQELLTGRIRLV